MDQPRGRCLVCHESSSSTRITSFICGDCGDLEHITVICACGDKTKYDPADGEAIAVYLDESTILTGGTVMKLSHCKVCMTPGSDADLKVELYLMGNELKPTDKDFS